MSHACAVISDSAVDQGAATADSLQAAAVRFCSVRIWRLHERTYAACSNANDTHQSAKPDLSRAAYDCLLERLGSSAAPSTFYSSSHPMHRSGVNGTASLLACLAVIATLGQYQL